MKRAMRQFLMILAVVIALPLTTAYGWSVEMMTAKQARDAALAGEIVLIDVRTADEWRATGIGDVATPITMHNNQFLTRLRTVIDQNPDKKIAFICAAGVRSGNIARALESQGITNVIDVAEGIMGSAKGLGWLKQGLPVKPVPTKSD